MPDFEDAKDLGRGLLEIGKMLTIVIGVTGGFFGAVGAMGWVTYGAFAEATDLLGITDPGSMAQWSTDFHILPQQGVEKFHDGTAQAIAGIGELIGFAVATGLLIKFLGFAMEVGGNARMDDRIKKEKK